MGNHDATNAEIQQRVALKEQQSVNLIELLHLNKFFDAETEKKFRALWKNGDFNTEIEKQKQEYKGPLYGSELEKNILNNLYWTFSFTERRKYNENVERIQEQIVWEVLDEMSDIRNLRFPENTDRNIGALFEQKRNAEIKLETTFKIRYPDGPVLPQHTNCNL